MIEAILQRFDVPQNAERLKAELGRELNGQLTYGIGAVRAGLRASVYYVVAGLFGIITVITVAVLFDSWLTHYMNELGAMAVTAVAFGLMSFIAILMAQSKIAEAPTHQTFKVPELYKKIEGTMSGDVHAPPPVQHPPDFHSTRNSSNSSFSAEGETRQWVLGLVKQGYSRHLKTGVTPVDAFIDNVRPDAEFMAQQGLLSVEEQLRNGSRPTIATILVGGLITGFLLSRRGGFKY